MAFRLVELDFKQSTLKRVMSSVLKLASCPATHVALRWCTYLTYRGHSVLEKALFQSLRSSPGSFCVKTTMWWFAMTSFFKYGLPVQKTLKKYIFNLTWSLLRWCYHEAIMKAEGEGETKKYFWDRKKNWRDVSMKYGRLVVFIR